MDGLRSKDDLYNQWESEYQRRIALLSDLQRIVDEWRNRNKDVAGLIRCGSLSDNQLDNAIAHMHERANCANALEDIIAATTPPAPSEPEAKE